MTALVVGALVVALALAVVIAMARDRGPAPEDVAVSYELAWDRFDFDALWTLSGVELHDGRDRRAFVDAKSRAYEAQAALRGLAARVDVDDVAARRDVAVVRTRVELRDGTRVRNRVHLIRRGARWQVVGYELEPEPDEGSGTGG